MDFDYVVQRQEKTKVCFGSGLERKFLEEDKKGLVSKHARSYLRELCSVGPGSYDISAQTSALSRVLNKPTSKLGTVIGGRRAKRKHITGPIFETPGPGKYNLPSAFQVPRKQQCAPFNAWSERQTTKIPNVPGVGTYKVAPYKRRRTAFAYSFGGKKCLLPAVKMKCMAYNFDTCESCKKIPEGDYWYLEGSIAGLKSNRKKGKKEEPSDKFLCRSCYEIERQEKKIFTKGQMKFFKKIRSCSTVHFHGGCQAKIFLISPQEIEKLKEREGYLALYFS